MTYGKPGGYPHDLNALLDLRRRFRALTLSNPNYFGNLPGSGLSPQAAVSHNTTFEELGCVGLQPQTERLEAVIYVNEPNGYGGPLCSPGSREFVRFYASTDHGGSWRDLGLAMVQVWDLPEGTDGRGRLEYAVTREADFRRRLCRYPQIVRIRAILSWDMPPPPDTPDFTPIWGNVVDVDVLVEPARRLPIGAFYEAESDAAVAAAPLAGLPEEVDPKAMVDLPSRPASLESLAHHYAGMEVPTKRLAMPHVLTLMDQGAGSAALAEGGMSDLAKLNLDLSWIEELFNPDGDTSFEELQCIGYDPVDDSMVGVIRTKRAVGYSGDPCTDGSREYVTFWADFDGNGSFETCLGTAAVQVYDVAAANEGLNYAVHLPADLVRRRRPCRRGAVYVPIRAILSWATPISCADPEQRPIYGNRLDTLVHIAPGGAIGDGLVAALDFVGGVRWDYIEASGLTKPSIVGVITVNRSPFGGRIDLAGRLYNGTAATRYRVMRRLQGGAFVPLSLEPNGISITLVGMGPPSTFTPMVLHADADGYYSYQDHAPTSYVQGHILAQWYTSALDHGKTYDLRIDVRDPANPAVDIESNVVAVHIDNVGPIVSLKFTTLAGDCAHFDDGAVFQGLFTVQDEHFGGFYFSILPTGPANGVSPDPAQGASIHLGGAVADPGIVNGTFELDTAPAKGAGMAPCGYALVLHGYDRTNVNSGASYHHASDSVGFCLGSPPKG